MNQPVSSHFQQAIEMVEALPFHAGDKVQVVVSDTRASTSGERYPLRGKPIRYTQPFESVVENDWEALK